GHPAGLRLRDGRPGTAPPGAASGETVSDDDRGDAERGGAGLVRREAIRQRPSTPVTTRPALGNGLLFYVPLQPHDF
ncbi:MAG TPA: hypothetical protein VKI65_15485, partial [Gemmataceae bacterium]|nr:hypothetical protein [Gemmataceae bacterium]